MGDLENQLQLGESDEPDYSKIPANFPRLEEHGGVSGFQPKLLLAAYKGRFYVQGCAPPDLYARWERCEDLAQQLATKSLESKNGMRAHMAEVAILDQYLPRLVATRWTSEAEAKWIVRRTAAILG